MKKAISVISLICILLSLSACDTGKTHITDSKDYKRNNGERIIAYFPETIDAFKTNSYSYTRYNYMDTCTEIFLDITVSEKEFDRLINTAAQYSNTSVTQKAYYDSDYTEIVYENRYEINQYPEKNEENVGNADIKKVIYNRKRLNIIYEYFYAFDTGVYPLSEVAYFNRFRIDEKEYVKHSESYYE